MYATTMMILGLMIGTQPADAQCNPTAAQTALQANTTDGRYQAIKYLEGCLSIPATNLTVNVGTFNAGTGTFQLASGIAPQTITVKIPEAGDSHGNTKPVLTAEAFNYAAAGANAVNITLSFQSATGAPIQASVKPANDVTATPNLICGAGDKNCPWPATALPANWTGSGSPANVNVGTATNVVFTLVSGGKTYNGYLRILRPPVIGVGAFTIPVLPVTIIYAPPQDQNGQSKNTNAYTSTINHVVAVSSALSLDNSTKSPGTTDWNGAPYADPYAVSKNMTDIGKNLPSGVGTMFGAVGTEVGILQKVFGSVSYTGSEGTTIQQNQSLTVTDSTSDQITTGTSGGPGLDDMFVYLFNVKVAWVVLNGKVQLTMLGYDRGQKTGKALLAYKDSHTVTDCVVGPDGHTQHCFTPDGAKALLSLDPFTASLVNTPYTSNTQIPVSQTSLPAPRFAAASCEIKDLTGSDGNWKTSYTHTVTQQDQSTTTTFSQYAMDSTAGWAAYSGDPGVIDQTQTLTTKVTNTVTMGNQVGNQFSASASFNPQGDPFAVESCFDSTFGGFAFLPLAVTAQPTYSGNLSFPPGTTPILGQEVSVQVAGTRYTTRTDAKGHYEFHIASLPQGPATLTVGKMSQPITITSIRPLPTGLQIRK
jgi:hypothetical protein